MRVCLGKETLFWSSMADRSAEAARVEPFTVVSSGYRKYGDRTWYLHK